MSRDNNILRIKAVARLLQGINKEVVFVGGATVALYADDKAAEARPTDDVDVVIELTSRYDHNLLEEELRKAGFENDQESGVISRFKVQGIVVDIMPTDTSVLGFANKWYPEGFKNSESYQLDDVEINIFALPYFIASKMEAYKDRGGDDLRFSTDFEDIVYVLENRKSAPEELLAALSSVRSYLKEEFKTLLAHPDLDEGFISHLEPRTAPQQAEKIKDIFQQVIDSV
jgi:predicted nucleotidyltransferase